MKTARVLSIAILMSVTGTAFADGPRFYPYGEHSDPSGAMSAVHEDRAEVVADLHKAERLGQMPPVGEGAWPIFTQQPNEDRAQVLGELHEAEQLGLMPRNGGGGVPVETGEQERLITAAGLRADEQSKLASQ
jgi:hypothetical protein